MPRSGATYALGQQVKVHWLPYAFTIAGGGGSLITGTQRHVRSTTIAGQTPPADVPEAGTLDQPYATLDYAISRTTANANEWIWVHGGHAETIIADSGVDVDIAGITVAWTGSGAMPAFTFATAAAADFKMAAANCRVFGLRFLCNIANQGMAIEWQADDCELAWCEFREGSATGLNFISVGLADGDSDRFYIHHNTFHAPTAGNYDHAIAVLFDMAGGRIEENLIYGDFDEAGLDIPVGGNAQVNLSIRRNTITNLQAGQHAIQINGAGSRGVLEDNLSITDAVATSIDPGGLALVGHNHWQVIGDSDFTSVPVFMPADQVTNPIGIDDADNAFASTNVVSNADGSLLERQEYLQTTQAVPVADAVTNVLMRDVVGIKTDAAIADTIEGAAAVTQTLMALLKATLQRLGADSANNTAATTLAVGNRDGSVLERLEQVQEDIRRGTGSGLAANESLVDILYGTGGIVTWPAAAAPANAVSMAEALRYIVEQQLWRLAISAFAFGDGTSALYTVTGVVEVEIFGVCTSSLTTGGVAPTIEVGVAGNTAVLIAQIVDGRDLLINEIYFDATPTTTVESLSTVTSRRFVITNGQGIIITVGGGALTAGGIDFYCRWRPLSATGAVVAA